MRFLCLLTWQFVRHLNKWLDNSTWLNLFWHKLCKCSKDSTDLHFKEEFKHICHIRCFLEFSAKPFIFPNQFLQTLNRRHHSTNWINGHPSFSGQMRHAMKLGKMMKTKYVCVDVRCVVCWNLMFFSWWSSRKNVKITSEGWQVAYMNVKCR